MPGTNRPVIAVTNPYIWPHVRRGSERLLNDLTHYLSGQGYEVEVYAMAPEAARWKADAITYHTIKQKFKTKFRQFNDCHYFAFALQSLLKQSRADVIHCLNYFDAFAAIQAKRAHNLNYKICFHAVGIPITQYFRSVPLDKWFMYSTLKNVDVVFALSRFACRKLKNDFDCEAELLPPPVMVDLKLPEIAGPGSKTGPKVLFVGDLLEPRKGALTLCRAFLKIKACYASAQLILSGRVDERFKRRVFAEDGMDAIKDGIHFSGLGEVDSLKDLYQQATVTVLPSVWEAFGMVMVESLAMGTPVVGTDHAGITDIIDRDDIGRLFDPGKFDLYSGNSEALANAILETIEESNRASTSVACHQRALEYSWQQLGPKYESWYQKLSAGTY